MIGLVRNIVLSLVTAFTVNAFADICEFCTYEVTAENIENYITEDKLKDTTAVFEILDKYVNWQAGTREDLIALMSQEVRDYPEFARTINNFIAIDPAVTEKKKATLWADSMIDKESNRRKKMNTTYTQKKDTLQRVVNNNAANVIDTSLQSASLQRKVDLADGAIQREALDEEEEPIQGKSIQREALPEEEEELA